MGGKGSSGPSQQQINQQAQQQGAQGARWNDIQGLVPYGHDQALGAWQQGRNSMAPPMDFSEMFGSHHTPSYHQAPPSYDGPSYEDRYAQQQADLAAAEEKRLRIEGENRRDSMYANYMDAASAATDFVTGEVDREMANARLLGIDYEIDDEQKSTRISDYFASIWGEGEQAELEGLFSKWGNPKGFKDWTVTRGDASAYMGEEGGEDTVVSSTQPLRPSPLDEEETLGAKQNVLGV